MKCVQKPICLDRINALHLLDLYHFSVSLYFYGMYLKTPVIFLLKRQYEREDNTPETQFVIH